MTAADVLFRFVALREDYPAGTCWAWMDSAERVCGKPDGDKAAHLCNRHAVVAARKGEAVVARDQAARLRMRVLARAKLPRLRAELAALDALIARIDPSLPTDDLAAYGGNVHPSIARQVRVTDSKIARMADLYRRRDPLASEVAALEALLEPEGA